MNQDASNNGLKKLNEFVGSWNPAHWVIRNGETDYRDDDRYPLNEEKKMASLWLSVKTYRLKNEKTNQSYPYTDNVFVLVFQKHQILITWKPFFNHIVGDGEWVMLLYTW